MFRKWFWYGVCLKARMMRSILSFRIEVRRKIWRKAALVGALLLAVAVPAPHSSTFEAKAFSVVGSDFISPLIASALGIQALNARLAADARFVGYDQFLTVAAAGSTRGIATVTRYSGEIFSLVDAEFLVRAEPGAEHHPIYISDEYWTRVLGRTPDVLGRSLDLCGDTFQISGVVRSRSSFLDDTELWMPLNSRGAFGSMTALRMIGMLKPGVSWATSEKDLEAALKIDAISDQLVMTTGGIHLLPFERKLVIYAPEKQRTERPRYS